MPRQGEKQQVAVRIPLRLKAELEREAAERGVSRSEYVRRILRDRHRADELAERVETREAFIDDLQEQLANRSSTEEKIDDLVRQESVSNAPFVVRWWTWWKQRRG